MSHYKATDKKALTKPGERPGSTTTKERSDRNQPFPNTSSGDTSHPPRASRIPRPIAKSTGSGSARSSVVARNPPPQIIGASTQIPSKILDLSNRNGKSGAPSAVQRSDRISTAPTSSTKTLDPCSKSKRRPASGTTTSAGNEQSPESDCATEPNSARSSECNESFNSSIQLPSSEYEMDMFGTNLHNAFEILHQRDEVRYDDEYTEAEIQIIQEAHSFSNAASGLIGFLSDSIRCHHSPQARVHLSGFPLQDHLEMLVCTCCYETRTASFFPM